MLQGELKPNLKYKLQFTILAKRGNRLSFPTSMTPPTPPSPPDSRLPPASGDWFNTAIYYVYIIKT